MIHHKKGPIILRTAQIQDCYRLGGRIRAMMTCFCAGECFNWRGMSINTYIHIDTFKVGYGDYIGVM